MENHTRAVRPWRQWTELVVVVVVVVVVVAVVVVRSGAGLGQARHLADLTRVTAKALLR